MIKVDASATLYSQLIVTSPKVKAPRGVTYGTGGIGNHPNICNPAMLPLTPFTCYDHKLVMSKHRPVSSKWTASSQPAAGSGGLPEYALGEQPVR